MKAKMKQVQWIALALSGLLVGAVFLEPAMALPVDVETGVPFSFDNREVNAALVTLYENDPAIWKPEQLFLIGMCYAVEQRLDEALAVFEKLHAQDLSNPRFLTDLGNIHHMKGELDEAERLYQQAWQESRYATALKQLAVLYVQTKGSASLEPLVGDLLEYRSGHPESLEIQKLLLMYSLQSPDIEAGGRVYARVARSLSKETIEENEDLRRLVLLATLRFKEAADTKAAAGGAETADVETDD
jgi:tetratricopeptide (TPR) repeat protein